MHSAIPWTRDEAECAAQEWPEKQEPHVAVGSLDQRGLGMVTQIGMLALVSKIFSTQRARFLNHPRYAPVSGSKFC